MLYLTCTTITSVDLPHYGVSRAKDWVSVGCGTISFIVLLRSVLYPDVITLNHMAKYHVDLLICITDLFQEIYIECLSCHILQTIILCMVYLA